jgi:hypothetical protein
MFLFSFLTCEIILSMTKTGKAGMSQTLKGNSGARPVQTASSCQKMVREDISAQLEQVFGNFLLCRGQLLNIF